MYSHFMLKVIEIQDEKKRKISIFRHKDPDYYNGDFLDCCHSSLANNG